MKKILFLFLFFLNLSGLKSQIWNHVSNLKHKKVVLNSDTVVLDSFSIIPGSILVFKGTQKVQSYFYSPLEIQSKIVFKLKTKDTFTVFYRTMDQKLQVIHRTIFESKNNPLELNNNMLQRELYYKSKISNQNWLNDEALEIDGSFYRGITVGNNQSAAIHSGFNLNMAGKLSNGVEINASITDANIPIQPEGNSASIQEFDKIFIQLKKDAHLLTLGDFDIRAIDESKFLKFDRKLQGINYTSNIVFDSSRNLRIGATAAITRGVFARNTIAVTENNQGPYKLMGNNGESFIIIIAGTERVFINGMEMKRGLDHDYIINYNMGEISFTSKRMITKDLRVIVEFQYSDRNYFRYTLEGHMSYTNSKLNVYAQVFSENDNKNQRINLDLDSSQVATMRLIGNNIENAYMASVSEINWDATKISYYKLDTTIQNIKYHDILVWANSSKPTVFTAIFSFLGEGKGNYRLKTSAANGSVYEFIPPINGILQGAYEPKIIIPTPKSHLQLVSGINYKIHPKWNSTAEVSFTDKDLNKFSEIGNNLNKGVAIRVNNKYSNSNKYNSLLIEQNSEYNSTYFNPLTRYRNLEFNRDWDFNISTNTLYEQHIHSLSEQFTYKNGNLKNISTLFFVPQWYTAVQNIVIFNTKIKKFNIESEFNILKTDQIDSGTLFLRPKINLFYHIGENKKWTFSTGLYHELKQKNNFKTQTLSENSFFWQNYFLRINTLESKPNMIDLKYIYRTEQLADSSEFLSPNIISHTFQLSGKFDKNPSQSFRWNTSYRYYIAKDSIANLRNEIKNNYLARIDYNGIFLKGLLKLNNSYEIKAGRQQKTQITYVRSPNGYGTHAWKDLNNNGIFELDEAYVSPFILDNLFIRFYNVLPEYVASNELNLSQNVWLQPKAIWFERNGIYNVINKFSYQMRFDMDQKSLMLPINNVLQYANPFYQIDNNSFIFSRMNQFHQFSFQKNENKIGFDLEWYQSESRNILSNGIDGMSSNTYTWRSRIEVLRYLTYFNIISNSQKINQSEYFKDRNYSFIENHIENTLSFMLNSNFKLNLNAIYWFKSTKNQFSINNQADVEFKFNTKSNGMIEAKFSTLWLNYQESIKNQQVELAMLNGIQKGTNYILNITIGQKLTKYLQLNLLYNGRKNNSSDNIVHLANVEVRAIF